MIVCTLAVLVKLPLVGWQVLDGNISAIEKRSMSLTEAQKSARYYARHADRRKASVKAYADRQLALGMCQSGDGRKLENSRFCTLCVAYQRDWRQKRKEKA